jgi:FemAB-related protein (PEP-CTERM system-associated)
MPIHCRDATIEDADRWDDYVASHKFGTPYHRYAWRSAMANGYGLETHYALAENGDGKICGIIAAGRVPHPLGRGRLCSLPYCDRGEPLAEDAQITDALLKHLQDDSRGLHELRGSATVDDHVFADDDRDLLTPGAKVRLVLRLPSSSDELFASFKSKHRSQINKARKNGLTTDTGNSDELVRLFYKVYAQNMRDLGSPAHSLRWFQAVAAAYAEDFSITLVWLESTVVGAAILLRCGTRVAIPWASTLREHNRLAPNMLLYWRLLADSADKGIRQFDFGRSSLGEGTYRFKTQWGARPIPLQWGFVGSAGDALSSSPAGPGSEQRSNDLRSALRSSAESIWRRLPLGLSVAIGSRLRPYISL